MREELGQYPAADPSLRVYVDLLKRRKLLIAAVLIVTLTVAATYLLIAQRIYRSSSQILVESVPPQRVTKDTSDPFSDAYSTPTDDDIPTQIQVLQSTLLFEEACKKAGVPPEEVFAKPERVYDTNVVTITVWSSTPAYATKLAKAYPTVYLNYISGGRTGAITDSLKFAKRKLASEKAALSNAEIRLENLKRRAGISDLSKQRDVAISGSAAVSLDASKAQMDLEGLRQELATTVAERRATPKYILTPTTVTNTRVTILRQRLEDLAADKQKALVLYKEGHPKVQEIDSQINAIQRQIDSSPPTITTTSKTINPALAKLDSDVAGLKAAVNSKQAQVNQARIASRVNTNQVGRFTSFERLQDQLQREIDQHRDSVMLLAKGVNNLSIREQASRVPVKLITPADEAELLSPKPLNVLSAALMLGLFLGLCSALARDYFDTKIYSWQRARRILKAPVLGFVPAIEAGHRVLGTTKDQEVLQAYRVLRTNVQFSALGSGGSRAILFTATLPGEGKTTTAMNYATSVAMDGKSVLIIDVDLMNPNVHKEMKLDRAPGLTDVLRHDITLTDAIKSTEMFGLRVLSAGTSVTNGTELLNSHSMKDLIREAKEFFDVVVLDGPGVLAGADALIASSISDGVIYVVQPGRVKEPSLYYAVHMLRQAKANVMGVVFNQIDDKSMESAFYYGAGSTAYGVFQGLPTWQTPELPSGTNDVEPETAASSGPKANAL